MPHLLAPQRQMSGVVEHDPERVDPARDEEYEKHVSPRGKMRHACPANPYPSPILESVEDELPRLRLHHEFNGRPHAVWRP